MGGAGFESAIREERQFHSGTRYYVVGIPRQRLRSRSDEVTFVHHHVDLIHARRAPASHAHRVPPPHIRRRDEHPPKLTVHCRTGQMPLFFFFFFFLPDGKIKQNRICRRSQLIVRRKGRTGKALLQAVSDPY